ncbi:MAG: hypothetical protein ABIR32_05390 [Ilumatobacteraceae bacterium]
MYFVVERFWPGSTESAAIAAMERLCASCDRLASAGVVVRWLGGTFVPDDEAVSCRFEGTAQAIRAVHEFAGESFDRILPIVEFGLNTPPPKRAD